MYKTIMKLGLLPAMLMMAFQLQAQDSINRHRIGFGLCYAMTQLDGKPLPDGSSPNRVAPVLRYSYGKENAWFLRLEWRGTAGKWPMDKPANFNVSKKYQGMQWSAGVGRYWALKKNWYAITVLDGSWDRYRSEGTYGGGVTGLYESYDAKGNMMGAGINGGLEYRLNTRWRLSLETRLMLGALAGNDDTTNPLSSSNQVISNSSFRVMAQWIPVQALLVSYRF